jgi:hypothetical protein
LVSLRCNRPALWGATLLRAPRLARFALVWLMSLNARQQFFFEPSPEPRETLNLCLKRRETLNLRLESIEELDDLVILMTKRIEIRICRH